MSVHRASSKSWGDEACARLCQIIIESNTGAAQQIMEDRTDLLECMSFDELVDPDDLGLTLTFLSVYYDKPNIISYLHSRGIDLSKPCDPLDFGTPMFYAVQLGRIEIIKRLHNLGHNVKLPCNSFGQLPIELSDHNNDPVIRKLVCELSYSDVINIVLFRKNILKIICRKRYLVKRKAIICIQSVIRAFLIRKKYLKKKNR